MEGSAPRKSRRSSVVRRRGETETGNCGHRGSGKSIQGKGESIMGLKPTHEQAQLHLQVYDQRREARLRQARDWFFKNYFVENFDDSMRMAAPGTENGTHAMMVLSYWEQACALLNYGLLHEDLFFETSGEFFGVWEL